MFSVRFLGRGLALLKDRSMGSTPICHRSYGCWYAPPSHCLLEKRENVNQASCEGRFQFDSLDFDFALSLSEIVVL